MKLNALTFRLKVMGMIEQGATDEELGDFIYNRFVVPPKYMTEKRKDFIAHESKAAGQILGMYENNMEEYIKFKKALEELKWTQL